MRGRRALDVYRVLRNTNPSPYMYLFSLEDADGAGYSIVGSSPEALVTVTGDEVITHPIAGSRPRGTDAEEDKELAEELLADAKERAEHLMLVDLARNDISKVCEPGSVDVTAVHGGGTVQPHHAPGLHRGGHAVARTRPPTTCWPRRSRPARSPARPSRAPCGCWTSWNHTAAASTAEWWATWTSPATWTWPSPSAPRCCAAARPTFSPAAGSWRTPQPEAEAQETVNKAAAPLRAVTLAARLHQANPAHVPVKGQQ